MVGFHGWIEYVSYMVGFHGWIGDWIDHIDNIGDWIDHIDSF
jgi:hypothetical protein